MGQIQEDNVILFNIGTELDFTKSPEVSFVRRDYSLTPQFH